MIDIQRDYPSPLYFQQVQKGNFRDRVGTLVLETRLASCLTI